MTDKYSLLPYDDTDPKSIEAYAQKLPGHTFNEVKSWNLISTLIVADTDYNDPSRKGELVRGVPIRMMDELEGFLKENPVEIAALTMPSEHANEISFKLIRCGIKAIWNYTNTDLEVPEDVVVENVHLSESLLRLSYRLNEVKNRS